MSTLMNDFYAALRTVIKEVWPEVIPNGVWEADHVENVPWADLVEPYAVIAISSMPKAQDYGAANQAYLPEVQIYYVEEVDGPLSTIRQKLEALDDALMTTALSTGQVMTVQDLSWSMEIDANQVFVSKDMPHRAGRLTVTCLVGRVIGGNA